MLKVAPKDLRLEVAFRVADDVLRQGIQGIAELVSQTGMINLDFANIATVIRQGGNALMAIGHGDNIQQAAQAALRYPLLENETIDRATALLVHVTGGPDLALMDVNQVMGQIVQSVNPAAEVLFGATEEPEMEGRAQVILIATGIRQGASPAIAVQSLFGVPAPEEEEAPEEEPALEAPSQQDNLDVPAFMRRRSLFRSGSVDRRQAWATG